MNNLNIIKEKIESFFVLMKEGYTLKDKMIIFMYYLHSPLHFINYLRGVKNSRKLRGDVYIKNKFGFFYCGNNYSSVYGCSTICEPIMSQYVSADWGVAVDIGSNCGMFTIPLAKMLGKRGKVISIEPNKNNLRILRKNIKLNELRNVKVVEKGCYSRKKKMNFYIDEIGTGGHSLLEIKKKGKKETILVDTLDNILKELKIKEVSLIKMDVMGVELETLEGAKKTLKSYHPKIVFELLHKEDKEKVYNFLKKYNYVIKQITDWNHVAVYKYF